ncbi:hypothetical protein ACFY7Z_05495 [Streptomyces sp. NPDC012623]|uniref:hypothetical protein n=1 Tax=unclassified Streptomyces TaxID=2593676 RepID=UPI0036BB298C
MVRNVIGSLLALAGAAAAVFSPFRAWYDGRAGRDYRVTELFGGISGSGSGVLMSLLLPFACAALLTLIALALRSRLLVALAGLAVVGFTVLWMVRQGQSTGSLTLAGDGSGLGVGVAYALGGGVVLLLAALTMSGRRRVRPSGGYPDARDEDAGYGNQGYEGYGGYGDQGYAYPPAQEPREPHAPGPHPPPRDEWSDPAHDGWAPDAWSHDGDTQSLPVVRRPPHGRDA